MTKDKHYSTEKNIQILLAVLKANGIKKVITSPGATNFSLVGSLQCDPFFQLYSSVDERSAAYMACGMAAESGEPVVLSCTGATASRDYYPGLTEAFYRKLPVLAVTSHQGTDRIGQLIPQNIDRRQVARDVARIAVELPIVKDARDEAYVTMEVNKAVLELRRNGGGPVHINIVTTYSRDFSVEKLPDVRAMRRYHAWDALPEMPKSKVAVFVGSHMRFTEAQERAVDRFCATHDAYVICDHTSGYYGKYKLLPTLLLMQEDALSSTIWLDLMVHIGEVSAAAFTSRLCPKAVWRVSEDGELRDPFHKLSCVFQMSEESFFLHYSEDGKDKHSEIDQQRERFEQIYASMPELPFSNIWIAKQLSARLPEGSEFHISASNSRRCWNMFYLPEGVEATSNVGCCGIDGATSSLIGASLTNPARLYFGVTGDLAFFYDLNALGNRHVGRNVRLLLINNGIGAEFKLSPHPCYTFGDEANSFMAAGGHFGGKSHTLVKHFAEDLGFRYLSASSKEEFTAALEEFTCTAASSQSIILECFTQHEDENEALRLMTHIKTDFLMKVGTQSKKILKPILGETGVKKLKSLLGH
ncbi:MAG: 2-succinyl-5-enolpyruvyl-6-hydroxy-3-cyclohexene-1-carboxylate synthase [Prevotellaceae bacterium]|nr:2-succinyl-5-enolpyruvyl-6-hydroxy-3-cyclohexene-1-carboxylate synthase [Prevotellaceae bacterium]